MATNTPAQNFADYEDSVKTLIVKVHVGISRGSGIIFGVQAEYLYFMTAWHVTQEAPQKVRVEFEFVRNEPVKAEFESSFPKLDLVVYKVNLQTVPLKQGTTVTLPFQHLSVFPSLKRPDPVYPAGHPSGEEWYIPTGFSRVKAIFEEEIQFEPTCAQGYSGGGVFDAQGYLAGMILKDHTLYCEAVSFERLSVTLERRWGLTVNRA
ncbi:MAG: trypsin-like peptidase domain-containing protein, partial [Deltaproteobacteria bacterium]|nr:trypsin-like peptidase domain-containing protein [Deltaproteobacteria bacterium]